jgi:hypothetical protein
MGTTEASVTTTRTPVNARRTLQVALPSLFVIGVALGSPAACSQPAFDCTAELGLGIARYEVQGTFPTTCANSGLPNPPILNADGSYSPPAGGPTNEDPISWYTPTAESFPLGIEAYTPDPEDPNYANEVGSLAIKPEWIGIILQDAQNNGGLPNYPYASAAATPAPPPNGPPSTDFPYAWGTWDTITPNSNGICHAADMTSDVTYPDIPSYPSSDVNGNSITVPDQPQTHVKYAWTNVRTYVTAAEQGVMTYANLAITRDACTVNYAVSILVPRVTCTSLTDSTKGDQTLCSPFPAGPNNPFGSGISQNITPICENVSNDPANPDFECLPPSQANDPVSRLQ